MVELHPEARKLLEAARAGRTPNAEDSERVFAALMASVSAAVPAAAAASKLGSKSGLLGKAAGKSATLWLQAAASVAVLSGAGAAAYVYQLPHVRPSPPALRSTVRAAIPNAAISAPAPPAPARAVEPSVASAAPHAPPVTPRPTAAPLSPELVLLRQARDARHAGQPERALEFAREHAESYPHSALWAERETLRVLALCDLGRVAAARSAASSLEYLWSSPLRASLNASCVAK